MLKKTFPNFKNNLLLYSYIKLPVTVPWFVKNFTFYTLHEIGLNGTPNPTYGFSSISKDEMIHETISFFNKFGLNPDGKDKSLQTIYWKQKMRKEVFGTRFIVVSKSAAENLFQK